MEEELPKLTSPKRLLLSTEMMVESSPRKVQINKEEIEFTHQNTEKTILIKVNLKLMREILITKQPPITPSPHKFEHLITTPKHLV